MVATLALVMTVSGRRRGVHQQLGPFDALEVHVFIYSALRFIHLNILEERSLRDVESPVLVEEVLRCS